MPKLTDTQKIRKLRDAVSGCIRVFDDLRASENLMQMKTTLAAIPAVSKQCVEVMRTCKE